MTTRTLLLLLALLLAALDGAAETILRRHVGAGHDYPETREKILEALQRFYSTVNRQPPPQKLIATIIPHSPWGFTGPTIAAALKELEPGQYERVIILAPSHYKNFEGCSIPAVRGFSTPLGLIPMEGPVIGLLNFSAQISLRGVNYSTRSPQKQLHENEYAIETILPFLHERLGPFHLIPILVGDLRDGQGQLTIERIDNLADNLRRVIDEKTLIVISTDFTHFGNDFSFRPFNQNIPQNIEQLDQTAFDLILRRDFQGFLDYLKATKNPICGQQALLVLMRLLPPQAQGQLLHYTQSMSKTKRENRSISYASINFYDPTQPPRPSLRLRTPQTTHGQPDPPATITRQSPLQAPETTPNE